MPRALPVLDGEDEGVIAAAQVEVGVAPGVEVTRAAQALAGLRAGGAVLAGVVDDDDGDVAFALQLAEVGEQRGDLAGVVLVDAVQPDERVEQEQSGREAADGLGEAVLVALGVEPQRGGGDDIERQSCEVEAATGGQMPARRALTTGARPRPCRRARRRDRRRAKRAEARGALATERAMSSASQLLQHLGAPPRIPTPARAHSDDQPAALVADVVELGGARRRAGASLTACPRGGAISSRTASSTCSSTKLCSARRRVRRAARRSFEASRGTPRLLRKSISSAGSARSFWVAPAALRACSTTAAKASRSSGSRWSSTAMRVASGGVLLHLQVLCQRRAGRRARG